MRFSIVSVLLMMGGTAVAHEFWANGAEVDPLTKKVAAGNMMRSFLRPRRCTSRVTLSA